MLADKEHWAGVGVGGKHSKKAGEGHRGATMKVETVLPSERWPQGGVASDCKSSQGNMHMQAEKVWASGTI